MRHIPAQKNNLKMVVIFLTGVFTLLFLSLLFKCITVVARSSFDGVHTFTTVFSSPDAPGTLILASYAPDKEAISLLSIKGAGNYKTVGETIGVPVDSFVESRDLSLFVKDSEPSNRVVEETKRLAFSFPSVKTNLTVFDVFRLVLFATSVEKHNILERSLSLPMDEPSADRITSFVVGDQAIAQERKSIAIINATSVGGLGARLGRLLNNMGSNVVSVATSDTEQANSKVAYYKDASYTAKRIGKVLSFPLVEIEEPGVADIIIYIGNDKKDQSVF